MPVFRGFPSGRVRLTSIPSQFFSELMHEIEHLGELKTCLYVFYRLERMEGNFRYLLRSEFLEDEKFLEGLTLDPNKQEICLDESLKRAVNRGVLLAASLAVNGQETQLYFINTPKGRAAVEAIARGEWRMTGDARQPLELAPERPNIYRIYEENIGPLTPMIADMLRDAEDTYPATWIEEAVRISVANNVRRWRYVEAILRHWKEEGPDERKDRQNTEEDFRRYTKGKFAEFLNP